MLWKRIIENTEAETAQIAVEKLNEMQQFCTGTVCRHEALVSYFGQHLGKDNCGACDVCLSELETAEGAGDISKAILACVEELGDMAGPSYATLILAGSLKERVIAKDHQNLSSHGRLADHSARTVRDWLEQMVDQGYLEKRGDYHVLHITDRGHALVEGGGSAHLLKPAERLARRPAKKAKRDGESWEGVDEGLFEALRLLRREQADGRNVQPFVIFGDAALRDMARRRPTTAIGFLDVSGVGKKKLRDFGEEYLAAMAEYCAEHGIETDVVPVQELIGDAVEPQPRRSRAGGRRTKERAFEMFAEKCSPEEVGEALARTSRTVEGYLCEYIEEAGITDPEPWVHDSVVERVREARSHCGDGKLKPILEYLDGEVSYGEVRVSLACLRNRAAKA